MLKIKTYSDNVIEFFSHKTYIIIAFREVDEISFMWLNWFDRFEVDECLAPCFLIG